jgi:hypothetical protein
MLRLGKDDRLETRSAIPLGALFACLLGACPSSSGEDVADSGQPGGVVDDTGGSATGTGGAMVGSGGALSGSGGDRSGTGGGASSGGRTGRAGATGTGNRTGSGGASQLGGTTGAGGTAVAGTAALAGATGAGGSAGAGGTSTQGRCTLDLPATALPADVSKPTTVIGTGTADGCTFDALNAAVKKAGVITFNCGTAPVTIPVTATMVLSIKSNTVIDGGNTITLDGQSSVQIFNFTDPDWMKNEVRVTLQHLTVVNAKTTPVEVIPTAPAPCSQGYNDGEGGAIFMRNGNLSIIDCTFSRNQAAPRGPDTGGGAIYINGSKHGAIIANSTFTSNSASNAGAVGALFATLEIYNSVFRDNKATGDGANNDDETKCSAINNGQHEIGSGGNGGAIYQDGASSTNVLLCGVDVENNAAGTGAFGGGVFMTSNDFSGTITVRDSIITGNTGGSWTQVNSGPSLGSAFGVNAKSSSIVNSTLQGVK